MNRRQGGWRKGSRIIDDAPTWQRAERGVEVIKTRLRQRQAEAISRTRAAAGSERKPQPIQNSRRQESQMQSPAPSSTMPAGSRVIWWTKPRSASLANAAAKIGSSSCRSEWRKRESTTLPSSTTAALAVKTRSGKPGAGCRVSIVAPAASRACRKPSHWRSASISSVALLSAHARGSIQGLML